MYKVVEQNQTELKLTTEVQYKTNGQQFKPFHLLVFKPAIPLHLFLPSPSSLRSTILNHKDKENIH